MNKQTTANVRVNRIVDATVDLDADILVAQIEYECAQERVAHWEDKLEEARAERAIARAESNLYTAQGHLIRAAETLQALELQRDTTTWERRQAEVTVVLAGAMAVEPEHAGLVDRLSKQIRMARHIVRLGQRDRTLMAEDEDRVLLLCAALHIVLERPDIIARLKPAVLDSDWAMEVAA